MIGGDDNAEHLISEYTPLNPIMAKKKARRLRAHFEEIDINKTGMITAAELKIALMNQADRE